MSSRMRRVDESAGPVLSNHMAQMCSRIPKLNLLKQAVPQILSGPRTRGCFSPAHAPRCYRFAMLHLEWLVPTFLFGSAAAHLDQGDGTSVMGNIVRASNA